MPRKKEPYSRGDINYIIDAVVHPFIDKYPWMRFVDGVLHALNEQNPERRSSNLSGTMGLVCWRRWRVG